MAVKVSLGSRQGLLASVPQSTIVSGWGWLNGTR